MLVSVVSLAIIAIFGESFCVLSVVSMQIALLHCSFLELSTNVCISIHKTDRLVSIWIPSLITPLVPWLQLQVKLQMPELEAISVDTVLVSIFFLIQSLTQLSLPFLWCLAPGRVA